MTAQMRIGRLIACAGSYLWFEAGGMGLSGVLIYVSEFMTHYSK